MPGMVRETLQVASPDLILPEKPPSSASGVSSPRSIIEQAVAQSRRESALPPGGRDTQLVSPQPGRSSAAPSNFCDFLDMMEVF